MPINLAMTLMGAAEFSLWVMLCVFFWRKGYQHRFPAMRAYLWLRVASIPVLMLLFVGQAQHWFHDYAFAVYFFCYWAVYLASAVILFFVSYEVFRSALVLFTGLLKLGTVAFRWAAIVSLLITLSNVSFGHSRFRVIPEIGFGLMRSVSILELCLLAFLCLSLNALRISARSMPFGIALGFGLLSSGDFILGSALARNVSLIGPMQFVSEALTLASLGIWVVYCALPEPNKKPFVVPANSTIYRWNEIASVLGHTGTRVAVQQPATGFFLTDVERVVEKVLARTMQNNE
jgi:hypothetical protein